MEPTRDFVVTSTITFRPHRVPPRCRKPRPVKEDFTHEFRIPCVSSDEAPVVALVPDDRGYYGSPSGEEAPIRAHDGKLYAAEMRGRTHVMAGSDAFRATATHESWHAWDDQAITDAGKAFMGILIIDRQVWKTITEPSYAIVTMGLGGNHGGTYLEIDYQGRYPRQFPLTDYDNAVEAAVAFATKRGDTNTIGIIRNTPRATILDPAAFKIPTEAQSRADAEAEVRALAEQATELLAGTLTRTRIGTIKDLLETAANRFWEHGLEEVPAVPAGSTTGSKIED
ncbi:MAG TPA: hypothetical protein VF885_15005 [Arthrobacter sp.]